jgi:predicted peptidase
LKDREDSGEFIDNILDNYNVDPGRVYLTGPRLGGYGTWNMAMMYPEYFAAIAPMCGGGIVDEAHNLRNMPVWVFQGAKDNSIPLENNRRMVDAVKAAGGDLKFTIYPNMGHDCWTASYNNQELYDWFLSHRKVGRR